MRMYIYHILHKDQLARIKSSGVYEPESFQKEGFIHCSTRQQVLPTANRRYASNRDLMLLVIDSEKVDAKIIYEDSSNRGEKHPHIYGRLLGKAIKRVLPLAVDSSGTFTVFPRAV